MLFKSMVFQSARPNPSPTGARRYCVGIVNLVPRLFPLTHYEHIAKMANFYVVTSAQAQI